MGSKLQKFFGFKPHPQPRRQQKPATRSSDSQSSKRSPTSQTERVQQTRAYDSMKRTSDKERSHQDESPSHPAHNQPGIVSTTNLTQIPPPPETPQKDSSGPVCFEEEDITAAAHLFRDHDHVLNEFQIRECAVEFLKEYIQYLSSHVASAQRPDIEAHVVDVPYRPKRWENIRDELCGQGIEFVDERYLDELTYQYY